VLVCVNGALGTPRHAPSDQHDSLWQRDTGWLQYYCESPQESHDTILQAFRVAEHVLLPAMVCVDGVFPSRASEPVTPAALEAIDEFLPPFEPPYALVPGSPHAFGGPAQSDTQMELRAQVQSSMQEAERFAETTARDYAVRCDRHHPMVADAPDEPCDVVLLTMGTMAGTARTVVSERRARGESVGLAKLHLFRPFPAARLREALAHAGKVAIVDRNISFGGGGILAAEVRAALCNRADAPQVFSFIAGVGGRDVTSEVIDGIISHTISRDRPEEDALWVGLKE
jgi:pyruvate/2-oxoacid:ferredoxin oxidoreductase alpha subunit